MCVCRWYFYIHPPKSSTNWLAYFTPFSIGIWISFLTTIALLPLLILLLSKLNKNDKMSTKESSIQTAGKIFFEMYSLIVQQGQNYIDIKDCKGCLIIWHPFEFLFFNFHLGNLYESHQLAITFIVGLFGFFSMIMYQTYCANLISIILNRKVLPPFNSWDTLYDRSEYTIGYVEGTFLDEFLKVWMNTWVILFKHFTKSTLTYMYIHLFSRKEISSCKNCIMNVGWLLKPLRI